MRTREPTAVGLKCPRPGERQPRGVLCQLGFLPNLLPSKFSFPNEASVLVGSGQSRSGFPTDCGALRDVWGGHRSLRGLRTEAQGEGC